MFRNTAKVNKVQSNG